MKSLIKNIVKKINESDSIFTNEELEKEYLEQIETNDYQSMLDYLKYKKIDTTKLEKAILSRN